jgi:hypothetical protein
MQTRVVLCVVLLVLGGAVALWRSQASAPGAAGTSGASSAVDEARRCLLASPGFEVRDNPEAKGAKQLLVTTPSGRTTRQGNVTIHHEASVMLTFFASQEEAARWSDALHDLATQTAGAEGDNEMVGTVFVDWSVAAPEGERQAVHDCVAG